jgi:hypothetical protein
LAARHPRSAEEATRYATAVRVDAMTLMGEFLKRERKNLGTRPDSGGTGAGGTMREPPAIPTMEQLFGPSGKKEAADAQALADLKAETPAEHEQVRAGAVEPPPFSVRFGGP